MQITEINKQMNIYLPFPIKCFYYTSEKNLYIYIHNIKYSEMYRRERANN